MHSSELFFNIFFNFADPLGQTYPLMTSLYHFGKSENWRVIVLIDKDKNNSKWKIRLIEIQSVETLQKL